MFHPVYTVIASCSEDATIKIWDMDTNKILTTLKGHTSRINDICFDEDGSFLASCSNDLSIKIWDMNKYKCLKTLNGHDHTISSIAYVHG